VGNQSDEDEDEEVGDKSVNAKQPKTPRTVPSDGFKWRKYGRKTVNGEGMLFVVMFAKANSSSIKFNFVLLYSARLLPMHN
jgi:hypothetical protein